MGLSKAISTLIGVISIVTLIIALVTKSHDPLSRQEFDRACYAVCLGSVLQGVV